ncbi:MAG: SPOR domain-containing protein [Saprospiraceae bacterium]|nr:SPOR domain-containing protein [Saprospiraceae bacterium]
MKTTVFLFCLMLPFFLIGQETRPSYCDELPETYEKGASARKALPKFSTRAVKLYKVQVAILRNTNPANYPFHPKLVARFRPCEQVWVVESKDTFKDRKKAEELKVELKKKGYGGCYITELIGYE